MPKTLVLCGAIAISLAFVLALAVAGNSPDPIIGTWKLNIAKSRFGSNAQENPKEGIETYRTVPGDQIELSYTRKLNNGSSVLIKGRWPAQGGAVTVTQIQGAPEGLSWIETLIAPGDWYVTRLLNGKQIGVMHKTFSRDGKTMTQTSRIIDAQGKFIEEVAVLDRQ